MTLNNSWHHRVGVATLPTIQGDMASPRPSL